MNTGRGASRRAGERTRLGVAICLAIAAATGCQEREIRGRFEAAERLRAAGDLEGAAAEYRTVVLIDSAQADAQNNLGHLFARMGKPDSALLHYRQALVANPDFAEAHFNKGVLFAGQGLVDSAMVSYQTAIEIDSTQADAHNNLGASLEGLGKVLLAIDQYAAAVRHQPGFAGAHANLGRASLLVGDGDRAIRSAHRAIELQPGLIDGYVTLGTAYVQKGNFDRALQFLLEAERFAPDDSLIRQNIQYVRERKAEYIAMKDGGGLRAAHIVVENEDLAELLLKKVREGEDFAQLARIHSLDPSRAAGGDIGVFKPGDLMPEFEQVVKGLKPGEVAGPLKLGRRWHVIKRQ